METNGVIVGEPVLGFCPKCRARVAARYIERDGGIFLRKDCSACGPTEALISTDAGKWHRKRAQCGYEGTPPSGCLLNCTDCNHGKTPTLVFLDVTNRCNMNCPICLANLDAMGFEFDPPMEYFDKVFEHLSKFSPRPKIQLFGGEPTVRNDLIEIIKRARTFGLAPRGQAQLCHALIQAHGAVGAMRRGVGLPRRQGGARGRRGGPTKRAGVL